MLRQGFEAALNADYTEFESDGSPIPNESLGLPTMNWGELSANAAGGYKKGVMDDEDDDEDEDEVQNENRKRMCLNAGDVLPDSGGFASVARERAAQQRREVRNRKKAEAACNCKATTNAPQGDDVLPVGGIDWAALAEERRQK